MKKVLVITILLALFIAVPIGVQAYNVTVTDPANDQIGNSVFDTTQISYNVDTRPLVIDIITNYPEAGYTVGSWETMPADLILWGKESSPPAYAIPLVSHDGFTAGTLYTVSSWLTSDDIATSRGITSSHYTWGFGENVWINSGSSLGFTGTVSWGSGEVTYTANNWYWTDANPPGDYLDISWATATCANDVVRAAPVPEPATMFLLGTGLIGLAGFGRKKFFKKG